MYYSLFCWWYPPTIIMNKFFFRLIQGTSWLTKLSHHNKIEFWIILSHMILALILYLLQKQPLAYRNEIVEIARMPPRLKHNGFYIALLVYVFSYKNQLFFDEIISAADCTLLFIVISMLNHPSINQNITWTIFTSF